MEKKYAIINGGLMVFRFDSLTPVTNLEVILKIFQKYNKKYCKKDNILILLL